MKVLRLIIFFTAFMFCAGNVQAQSRDEARSQFFKGNELYKQAQYDPAIQAYEEVLKKGLASGPAYYNLGNSYFKKGQLGKAILNYSRALDLDPRDADIRTNYQYSRRQMRENVFTQENVWERLWSAHVEFYTLDEMIFIIFIVLFFMVLIHLASLYMEWPAARRSRILFILFFIVIVFGCGLKIKIDRVQNAGIAVASAAVKYEPAENATTHFELPEGERIKILREENGWAKIQRKDGRLGWVKGETVEKI